MPLSTCSFLYPYFIDRPDHQIILSAIPISVVLSVTRPFLSVGGYKSPSTLVLLLTTLTEVALPTCGPKARHTWDHSSKARMEVTESRTSSENLKPRRKVLDAPVDNLATLGIPSPEICLTEMTHTSGGVSSDGQ